jgi:radical SAM protein with 4Fe4S-binding SPASM domain
MQREVVSFSLLYNKQSITKYSIMDTALTLSKDYVLRKSSNAFFLYHAPTSMRYQLTKELYVLLNIFKYNLISISQLTTDLTKSGIYLDPNDLLNKIKSFGAPLILVNESTPYRSAKYKSISTKESLPERIDWLITEKCNLACRHCLQSSSLKKENEKYNLQHLKKIFEEMEFMDIETLKITGGEPLLASNAKTIFRLMSDKSYEKTILTNLMLVDSEWIDIFKNKTFHLSTSIDGHNEHSHDYIRGQGSFKILVNNLKKLRSNDIPFASTVTIHPQNMNELDVVAKFIFETLDSKKIIFNYLRPIGRARTNKDLHLSKEDLSKVKVSSLKIKEKYGDKVLIDDESDLTDLPDGDSYSSNSKIKCAAGTTLMSLDEKLCAYPCNYGIGNKSFFMGSAKKLSLTDIWFFSKWGLFRDGVSLSKIEGCNSCKFISRCTLKQCRLKPLADGNGFYSHVNYCHRSINEESF